MKNLSDIVLTIGERPVSAGEVLFLAIGLSLALLALIAWQVAKAARQRAIETAGAEERAREFDDKVAELNRLQAEMSGRMQTMAEIFGARQSDLGRHIGDRIEALRSQVGQGLESQTRNQTETLTRLNERLAVIDAAQKNLTELTGQVVSLKDVLANKQARGAYGQGRMEAIVRDGLAAAAYEFQATLSNGRRPDCIIRLPGDPRPLPVDAKFPLEGFTAFRGATTDETRRAAGQRVRTDIGTHIKDISERYLLPGETQDMALMFVPSEAIYADLQEHFEDLVQRASRARIVIVSPSLLAMAIQVMQSLVRDARMRDEARVIQNEVSKLLADVGRLRDRVEKLDTHFRQAQEDVVQIRTSSDKIAKRGERIEQLEFDEPAAPAAAALPRPSGRGLAAE